MLSTLGYFYFLTTSGPWQMYFILKYSDSYKRCAFSLDHPEHTESFSKERTENADYNDVSDINILHNIFYIFYIL